MPFVVYLLPLIESVYLISFLCSVLVIVFVFLPLFKIYLKTFKKVSGIFTVIMLHLLIASQKIYISSTSSLSTEWYIYSNFKFYHISTTLSYYNFVVGFENRKYESEMLLFLFQNLWLFCIPWIPMGISGLACPFL